MSGQKGLGEMVSDEEFERGMGEMNRGIEEELGGETAPNAITQVQKARGLSLKIGNEMKTRKDTNICDKCFHNMFDPLGGGDSHCLKKDLWNPNKTECAEFLTDKWGIGIFFLFWIVFFSIIWKWLIPLH